MRKRRARYLGFEFKRGAGFVPPPQLQLGANRIELSLPTESGTRTAFAEILLDDCYRLRGLPDGIQSVLDIGAHAGLFSLAARMRWPGAEIHAYEPNPFVLQFLSKNSLAGHFSVFGEAVGLTNAYASLDECGDSVRTRIHIDTEGPIKCTSLRDAIFRMNGEVDLVKLDCEGAEWEILQDGVTWQSVRNLTMEFHLWAGYTLEQLQVAIKQLGFEIRSCEMTGSDFGVLQAGRSACHC